MVARPYGFRQCSRPKLDHRRFAAVGRERVDEHGRARRRGFRQSLRKVPDFLSIHFPAKGKRQMAIGDERRQPTEARRNAHPPESLARTADLNSVRSTAVGDHFALREAKEAPHERVRFLPRNVDPILGNGRERRRGCRDVVPIKLHGYAAGPLNDRIATDWIGEGRDHHPCPGRHSRRDRRVEVLD